MLHTLLPRGAAGVLDAARAGRCRSRTGYLTPARMFLLSILAVGLVYCGVWVVFGHGQTFRLGGPLALSAGVPLLVSIVGYVRRPVGVLPASPVGSTFPMAWPGYQAGEVDRVFAELGSMSLDDIEGVRFRKAAPGYDMEAVDRARSGRAVRTHVARVRWRARPRPVVAFLARHRAVELAAVGTPQVGRGAFKGGGCTGTGAGQPRPAGPTGFPGRARWDDPSHQMSSPG